MKRPGLSPREQDPEPVTSEDWGLTEADIGGAVAGAVGGAPNAGLFLGQYTHHGLEWLLEEVGLMTRLRDRGLSQLAVELDLADPMGQTLRVTTGHHHPVVVLELKLRVTRKEGGSPYDLLVVEWLLAQDTRAQEEENARPLLPGQKHRGMGLLRDTAAVLIVATERLELDGVMFTPSHFHLARLARGQGRFPVPEDEARYLAMEKSVKGLRLQEASAAVTQGRVRSHDTGEIVTWIPRKMIIPVNASLRKELHGDEFSSAVARASRQLDFRLD